MASKTTRENINEFFAELDDLKSSLENSLEEASGIEDCEEIAGCIEAAIDLIKPLLEEAGEQAAMEYEAELAEMNRDYERSRL